MTVIAQDDHLTAGAWAACGAKSLLCEMSGYQTGQLLNVSHFLIINMTNIFFKVM